jgi:hypothetical protein
MVLSSSETLARRLLRGDSAAAAQLASSLIVPERDNFIDGPWGGVAMRRYKRLADAPGEGASAERRIGEAFEIAAFDADPEAAQFPSRLRFPDGSELTLPQLLTAHGDTILGASFVRRFGTRFPLLPKTLNIRELLSVQGHPEGNTELYIIIDADPGATLRVGFNCDVDGPQLRADLTGGREQQRELLRYFPPGVDARALQRALQPWFADHATDAVAVEHAIRGLLKEPRAWPAVAELLLRLKALYWRVLGSLNAIPAVPGQMIHNATPPHVLASTGRRFASAEVHALGNPEGREILALEIRRPGPTFRAWDNVRFPIRNVDIDAAIAALNLRRTAPEDFFLEPQAVPGKPGTYLSVDSPYFRVEHFRPSEKLAVAVAAEPPHCLHVLAGAITVTAGRERIVGSLGRGESALVPVGVGRYVVSAETSAEVVKVSLPGGG